MTAAKTWLERYERYCFYYNRATSLFEKHYYINSWYALLLAEEALYKAPPTARQQEAQKLWQQRGLLERTYRNLQAVRLLVPKGSAADDNYAAAVNEMYWMIQRNKKQFATISERIPK